VTNDVIQYWKHPASPREVMVEIASRDPKRYRLIVVIGGYEVFDASNPFDPLNVEYERQINRLSGESL
jgi:hypothetical protein